MPSYCPECGVQLEEVRPGKHQHPECSQSPLARGKVTITQNEAGDVVAVMRTDDEHRILEVIWQRHPGVAAP